ncbi:hypothetical protein CYK22_01440 [Streptococcus salivarius]|nr:hypothetical protein CYK22_01440 [Streptococcus salivarius]
MGVSQAFYHLLLAIDTSKVFGYLVMQDINKKEGFSHPFFLKFAGFVWTRSVSLSVSKSVQATKNLYSFFSFIFIFSDDRQRLARGIEPLIQPFQPAI